VHTHRCSSCWPPHWATVISQLPWPRSAARTGP